MSEINILAVPILFGVLSTVISAHFGFKNAAFSVIVTFATLPLSYLSVTNEWIYSSLSFSVTVFMALIVATASRESRVNFGLLSISFINALLIHSIRTFAHHHQQIPYSFIVCPGFAALLTGYYALSKYESENEEITELLSISYWIENMSCIKSGVIRWILNLFAIIPGVPLQLALIGYSGYQLYHGYMVTGVITRLFVMSIMYSMVNVIVYFSITITRKNAIFGWFTMLNLFEGVSMNLQIGKFEQLWFICVLGLYAWTVIQLNRCEDETECSRPLDMEKTSRI